DQHGHHVGDQLLQLTAQRILSCLRHSDTVARFGGDEFVILLEHVDSTETAVQLAEKIRQALSQPFALAGQLLHILPSIGVALYPCHSDTEKELLLLADEAMYLGKKAGGNRVTLSHATKTQQSTA